MTAVGHGFHDYVRDYHMHLIREEIERDIWEALTAGMRFQEQESDKVDWKAEGF